MGMFRVTIRRVQLLEAEIEADSVDDARDMAASGQGDWTDATGGRGLGDDDNEVLDIEDISDEYDEEKDEQP